MAATSVMSNYNLFDMNAGGQRQHQHQSRAAQVFQGSHDDPSTTTVQFMARSHWVPDSYASNCDNCMKRFHWFFRRRHHCRQCGKVVCNACSTDRLPCFIPGCETVIDARCCKVCRFKRNQPGFNWQVELTGLFGHEVGRRGGALMAAHSRLSGILVIPQEMAGGVPRSYDNENRGYDTAAAMQQSRSRPQQRVMTSQNARIGTVDVTVHSLSHLDYLDDENEDDIPMPAGQSRREQPQPQPNTTTKKDLSSKKKKAFKVCCAATVDDSVAVEECPICQLPLIEEAGTDFQLPQSVATAHSLGRDEDAIISINACGHHFHAACIGKWLSNHTTCPMCRENAYSVLQ